MKTILVTIEVGPGGVSLGQQTSASTQQGHLAALETHLAKLLTKVIAAERRRLMAELGKGGAMLVEVPHASPLVAGLHQQVRNKPGTP